MPGPGLAVGETPASGSVGPGRERDRTDHALTAAQRHQQRKQRSIRRAKVRTVPRGAGTKSHDLTLVASWIAYLAARVVLVSGV